jgi:hypothetical protein
VALIRTDVSEDRIASIFRVHECEQVTERSCKLETSVLIRATRCHLPEDDNHQNYVHQQGWQHVKCEVAKSFLLPHKT